MRPETGRAAAIAAGTAALIFASRLLALHFSGEPLHPSEIVTGATANAIIEGAEMPIFAHRAAEQGWGTLALSFLTTPWFLVFGKTAISLKASALALAAISAALLIALAHRLEGSAAAGLAGLLCVIAPPAAFSAASFARGPALVCLALGLASLHCCLRTLDGRSSHYGWPILWGALSGLSISIDSAMLAPSLVPLGLALARDENFLIRPRAWLAFLGAALGIAPYIVLGQPEAPAMFPAPEAMVVQRGLELDVMWIAMSLPVILGLLGIYERTRQGRPGLRGEGVTIALWASVLGLAGFSRDPRLLDAYVIAAAAPAAMLCRRMLRNSAPLGVILIALVALPGAAGQFHVYRGSDGGSAGLTGPGYDRTSHLVEAGASWSGHPERLRALAGRINPRGRAALAFGAGEAFAATDEPAGRKLASCAALEARDRPACAVGLGHGARKFDRPLAICVTGSKVNGLIGLGSTLWDAENGSVQADDIARRAEEVTTGMDPGISSPIEAFISGRLGLRAGRAGE